MASIPQDLTTAIGHHQAGDLPTAARLYREILERDAGNVHALHLLGVLAGQAGQAESGAGLIRAAIALKSDLPEFHYNLGKCLAALGQLDEAAASYEQALALDPQHVRAHNNLGLVLKRRGQLSEAVTCYRTALQLQPDFAEAHFNLGNVLQEQGRHREAIQRYERGLAHQPDLAEAHHNLGLAYKWQGLLGESAACFERALQLRPDYVEAHTNLGAVHYERRDLAAAAVCYQRALQLDPDDAAAHFGRAVVRLLEGDFRGGWPDYQWRWQTAGIPRRQFAAPPWRGQPLAGQTILIHAEQGLGDTLQFVRYLPLLKQAGAQVVFEHQATLQRLLSGVPGADQLIVHGDSLPPCDLHAPLLSLPYLFGTALDSMPSDVPYLSADDALVEHWSRQLSTLAGLKVGICWRGNPVHRRNRFRALPLEGFQALAQLPGVTLISLEKDRLDREVLPSGSSVVDFGDQLDRQSGPFMDTAAIIKSVDLVISCDTAIAHLAGALGAAVWLALDFAADWRWLQQREDSPWYPTMRLFRQTRAGDWAGVFRRLAQALASKTTGNDA